MIEMRLNYHQMNGEAVPVIEVWRKADEEQPEEGQSMNGEDNVLIISIPLDEHVEVNTLKTERVHVVDEHETTEFWMQGVR